MADIPLAPVERILRRGGAKRVSKSAVEEFAAVLEEIAADIARESAKLAAHAGRKTIQVEDVKLARKRGF